MNELATAVTPGGGSSRKRRRLAEEMLADRARRPAPKAQAERDHAAKVETDALLILILVQPLAEEDFEKTLALAPRAPGALEEAGWESGTRRSRRR